MMGPLPVEDKFGMGIALILLKHSLDPGVTEMKVHYNTARKMKSALVNLYHASVKNREVVKLGVEMGKYSFIWMPRFNLNSLAVFKLVCTI
jgi:hypothetical protein